MKFIKSLQILGLVFIIFGCKKGVPQFQTINKLSAFTVDQSLVNTKNRTGISAFTLSGQCDQSINQIQLSFDNQSYNSVNNYSSGASFTCATNSRYSYTIEPSRSTQFNIADNVNSKNFYIRASGDLGFSQIYTIKIQVTSTGTGGFITAGSSSTATAEYILKGRVQNTGSVSANGYTLKGSIKVQ